MTTFYHYDKNGAVTASAFDPTAQPFTPSSPECNVYEGRGDIVGAYLARQKLLYPAYTAPESYYTPEASSRIPNQPRVNSLRSKSVDQGYWSSDGHESEGYVNSSCLDYVSNAGYSNWTAHSGLPYSYPDAENIRHLHTLHSLLPHLQPERKLNSLNGPALDVLEQDTGVTFAYQVPKKLLVLFLGRQLVSKFIRTISREDDDSWQGPPMCQELNLPRGHCSKAAIKILIAWMTRACQYHTMGGIRQICVPSNTFVACSLAQTMELLGLHKDALRVDHEIANTHFARPIFAQELETLWNCLGQNSRYVYAAIKVVGLRLREFEHGNGNDAQSLCEMRQPDTRNDIRDKFLRPGEMLAMLEDHPEMRARVRDLDLNEQHRPVFGTKWMRDLNNSTRQSQRSGSVTSGTNLSELTSKNMLPSKGKREVSHEYGPETTASR
jgi:hypothetical protein